jgi:glycolate oxidase
MTMKKEETLAALAKELGSDTTLITDPAVASAYSRDQAPFAPSEPPFAVVIARDIETISRLLRFANEHVIPVVIRGAGSGLAGGANSTANSIVLSLEKMNTILDIDPKNLTARVQAGVVNIDLDKEASKYGLAYLPDPASREWSTIGGNVATNAGGMCCVKYGVTSQHVRAMTVVLASGEIVKLGSATKKAVTTLDLASLMVGSEGTLGVIVEVTVSLAQRPKGVSTLIATFATITEAARASTELLTYSPSMLEIVDQTTINAVESWKSLGFESVGSVVLMQVDDGSNLNPAIQLCTTMGAIDAMYSDDPADAADLIALRKLAYPALERMGMTLLDDVAVPLTKIANLVLEVEEIATRNNLTIAVFGHAGDGNLHPTIVFPYGDKAAGQRAARAFTEIVEAAQSLGGTTSGEHGIGSIKRELVAQEIDQKVRELQLEIKRVFDPQNILNPGKKLI